MSAGIHHPESSVMETPQADSLQLQHYGDARDSLSPSLNRASDTHPLREQINWTRQLVVSHGHQKGSTIERTQYESRLAGARRELEILHERLEFEAANGRMWREKYWALDETVKEGKIAVAPANNGVAAMHDNGEQPNEGHWRVQYQKEKAERLRCEANCDALQREVTDLKLENARMLAASQPEAVAAAEATWRPKLETRERELDRSRSKIEDGNRELASEREMHEKAKYEWASQEGQLKDALDKKDAAIGDLEQEARRLQEELEAVRDDRGLSKNSLVAKYRKKMDQANRQANDLKFQLREKQLAVELLEMRLLEEEDANQLWKYKYVVEH
ncbi:hypothetical protein ASPVEDRAFT_22815 [Aspergillus versicolor CBS 583.65]|uniref:Uncharacterized protein n=1 Tax=Aspergillus versicolor CBS 583.65 TaxID=1036611 RepID=A0A1L9P2Q7_ASPVE|nr:uncharacterized protein ASPVEDRAFT_22815 [Aspergillus versicolor CBS 583.65]OJI95776.1 hypothetical protein ASPVEDRAFT_22815 [Aspergillus versicolor CBS 583.65]